MPPPWDGRGAVKRGEEVGNTGWALAWCVAYRSMSCRRRPGRPFVAMCPCSSPRHCLAVSAGALAWPHSLGLVHGLTAPVLPSTTWPSARGHGSLLNYAPLLAGREDKDCDPRSCPPPGRKAPRGGVALAPRRRAGHKGCKRRTRCPRCLPRRLPNHDVAVGLLLLHAALLGEGDPVRHFL